MCDYGHLHLPKYLTELQKWCKYPHLGHRSRNSLAHTSPLTFYLHHLLKHLVLSANRNQILSKRIEGRIPCGNFCSLLGMHTHTKEITNHLHCFQVTLTPVAVTSALLPFAQRLQTRMLSLCSVFSNLSIMSENKYYFSGTVIYCFTCIFLTSGKSPAEIWYSLCSWP